MTMVNLESVHKFAKERLNLENEKSLMVEYFDSLNKGTFSGTNHEREHQINSLCSKYDVLSSRLDEIIIQYMKEGVA